MSLNSVNGKTPYPMAGYQQSQKPKRNAYENFAGSVFGVGARTKSLPRTASENTAGVQMDYRYGRVTAELLLQKKGRADMGAVEECDVRYISYHESDYIKLYLADGYTLKAKADPDTHKVYVERKNEDGTYQAYEVDPLTASPDNPDPVVQAALAAWETVKETADGEDVTELEVEDDAIIALAFEKMLENYQEFVEKRLKDGPPKIRVGGSEFSEQEWELLLQRLDENIDAYKEELRKRLSGKQGTGNRTSGSAADRIADAFGAAAPSAAQTSEGQAIEGAKTQNGPMISETEALEGMHERAQRGSSFLARLSGEKKAPYSFLADESGKITYKGVTFFCDNEKQQICLGDMSNPKNVINIPLAKGGCLRVNRDNIGDLAKAIDMFSPEDIGRIMRAIAQDNKARELQWTMEQEKLEV